MKLARILNSHPAKLSHTIEQLEKASHHAGRDVALIADLTSQAHQVFKNLQLDARDTTANELYQALFGEISMLEKALYDQNGDMESLRIEKYLQSLFPDSHAKKDIFGLRLPVAKMLLQNLPPTQLMQHLGYKSVSAMLKNEDIWELYGALRFIETHAWQQNFMRQFASLSKKDFVLRPMHVITMSDIWLKPAQHFMRDRRHGCFAVKEMGMVASLPLPARPGALLLTVVSALHYMNETILYSNYFRRLEAHDFGPALADTIAQDQPGALIVGGQKMHWRVVQKHFAHNAHSAEHMKQGFNWLQVEQKLYEKIPSAKFWQNNENLALECDGMIFSANLFDNSINYYHQAPVSDRSHKFMRLALETELYSRYLHAPILREHAVARVMPVTTG